MVTNGERKVRAETALTAYMSADTESFEQTFRENLIDMFTDLLHLAAHYEYSDEECAAMFDAAQENCEAELEEETISKVAKDQAKE